MQCVWCQSDLSEKSLIRSFLFPKVNPVCSDCQRLFYELSQVKCCVGCGRELQEEEFCYDCIRWREQLGDRFVRNLSLYAYDEIGKEWMERYKFIGDTRVVIMMTHRVYHTLMPMVLNGWRVCPLPSSKKSLKKREFETIEYLLFKSRVPYTTLLQNIGVGKKQSEKTRKERMMLEQPFKVIEGVPLPEKVVLVDDVYTTGRTIRLAAECLQEVGVREIRLFTLFR